MLRLKYLHIVFRKKWNKKIEQRTLVPSYDMHVHYKWQKNCVTLFCHNYTCFGYIFGPFPIILHLIICFVYIIQCLDASKWVHWRFIIAVQYSRILHHSKLRFHDLLRLSHIPSGIFFYLQFIFHPSLTLVNPIRTMLIQLNWLSLPRPFQEKHPYALP